MGEEGEREGERDNVWEGCLFGDDGMDEALG